ncbi:tRNA (mnm(5)s(2)U34)-methyltransferase [Scopulibacillus cellulosilyticus]|uniref:Class I SAM-dependent methyltransferase n=1 Tax=Scopulibacillus cellulosilyticus TaxID=2665665 RepID=A0ABW2PWR3_9BACL
MIIKNAVELSHEYLAKVIQPGDTVVDATVGNGHDTLFLAKSVGKNGCVYGFDIQKEAINNTEKKLASCDENEQVKLICKGHHELNAFISDSTEIKAAVFNLGYLPSGDKTIVTRPETTIQAVQSIQERLHKHGLIVLVVYPGHPEGKIEADAVLDYVKHLDQKQWRVLKYEMFNQINNPPFLIVIEGVLIEGV